MIGDEALKALDDTALTKKFPHMIDLSEEWHKWQDLPFVFARWMIRKKLKPSDKTEIKRYLTANLNIAYMNLPKIVAEHENAGGFSYSGAVDYLKGFTYRLGKPEQKAIVMFRRLMTGFAATICGC